jgi:hypothetical protein
LPGSLGPFGHLRANAGWMGPFGKYNKVKLRAAFIEDFSYGIIKI